MIRWEYCAIEGIKGNVGAGQENFQPYYPKLIVFTSGGKKIKDLNIGNVKDQSNSVATIIAQLGEEGWEMVGTGSYSLSHSGSVALGHTLYFKRPKTT